MSEFANQFYPSLEELKNRWLRAFAGAMSRRGATANVLPGSEADFKANATSQQAVVAFANNKISQKNWSPLTSTGQQLLDLCQAFGVEPRDAGAAAGQVYIRVAGSGTVSIPADFVCVADDGTKYKTTTVNLGVADGALVEVIAIDGGKASNKPEGTLLRWEDASIASLKRECEVAEGGLVGGRDADTEEVMRSRLLSTISTTEDGYNWAQVKVWAEEANAAVTAWVYCGILGPSSVGVAIARADGDRELDDVIVQQVAAYIAGKLPGRARLNVTSVNATPTNICLSAELPATIAAGGDGGGWFDIRPWPNATTGVVSVASYDSGTKVITTSETGGTTGIAVGTRIAIWDSTEGNEKFFHYTVTEVTSTSPISFKVQGGPAKDHAGAQISADAANLDSYGATVLKAMLKLGPGEKSSSYWVLPRALRKPSVSSGNPASVNSKLKAEITNAHKEVSDLEFVSVSIETPAVPAATSDPPNILTLGTLSFIASTA